MIAEQPVIVAVHDGVRLEAHLALPAGAAGGVVVAHPHPLYGGDMDNPVVQTAVAACAGAGLATLRFNFRGVGASTGRHGGGEAERRDLEAALDHLASALAPAAGPLGVAGYSFGAAVAADLLVHRPRLAGLALIAPPLAMLDGPRLAALAAFAGPLLVVAGSQDHLCPGEALVALAARLPGAVIRTVERADHFFMTALGPLADAVAGWAAGLQTGKAGRRGGAG